MPKKNQIRKIIPRERDRIAASDDKLYELVILFARRSEGDPLFGSLKLNKLLFYADFFSYLMLGKPITGQEYFALENGPALRYKARLWQHMIEKNDIVVRKEPTIMSTDRETTLALREPDVTKFSPQELDLAYVFLEAFRNKRGTELSLITHTFPGWQLAKERETIPYSAAFVGERKPTRDEMIRGLELENSMELAPA
jgi:hypothetical protein